MVRKIVLFKPYTSIKNFLYRFTILKIGKLHIRLHKIVDKDRTTLLHNHPFNYISIILKGGYTETYLENGVIKKYKHHFLSIIKRNHNVYHRIDDVVSDKTITLFIAYGNYKWNAYNINNTNINYSICERIVNNKKVWAKNENGIWFIGQSKKLI